MFCEYSCGDKKSWPFMSSADDVPVGHEIALDCGSGGTRVWQRKAPGGIERLRWPGPLQAEKGEPSREGTQYGGKAPVLSQCLGRECLPT